MSFILRTVGADDSQRNMIIGDSYQIFSRSDGEPFRNAFENVFGKRPLGGENSTYESDNVHSIITSSKGSFICWAFDDNYIMLGNGSTFAKVNRSQPKISHNDEGGYSDGMKRDNLLTPHA